MLEHKWSENGITYYFHWLGDVAVPAERVYALAFTAAGEMLLVSNADWAPKGWLPGGGLEAGETELEALRRELVEEANATILTAKRIGVQESTIDGNCSAYQSFYWCRIEADAEFVADHEITLRYFVDPDQFLDTLFWGRKDPKAAVLLAEAIQINQQLGKPVSH